MEGKDGKVRCGSRKRELGTDKETDNAGFCKSVVDSRLFEPVFAEHPDWLIYGEWLVPHTLRTYKADSWSKFYVFDIVEVEKDGPTDESGNWTAARRYLTPEEYITFLEGKGIACIPVVAKLTDPTEDDAKALLSRSGEFLVEGGGLGEGIVLKNYAYRNKYGRQVWAKMLTADFLQTKKLHRAENHEAKEEGSAVEAEIANKWLTPEAVSKEFLKFKEDLGRPYEKSMLGDFLRKLWKEWIDDNIVLILNELGTPKIDFGKLRKIVTCRAAEQVLDRR